MRVSVSDAGARLAELVRRAKAGEEVILTRRGQGVVRFEPIETKVKSERKRALLEALRGAARTGGQDAAHSADFLYDEFGEPA